MGFSVLTNFRREAAALSRRVRALRPEVAIVWGGPHVTALGERLVARGATQVASDGTRNYLPVAAVPNASVATIVAGSTPGPGELRAGHLRIPLDVRSFAIRCSDVVTPVRRQVASLIVLDIGALDDLPRAIRTLR